MTVKYSSRRAPNLRFAMLRATRRAVARTADTGRRIAHPLPAPVRARLRDVVAWVRQRQPPPPIADWSRPLIGAHHASQTSCDLLIGAVSAEVGIKHPHSQKLNEASDTGQPALRCLVVTSRLDVGGMDEVVAFLARRLPAHGLQTAVLHATSWSSADGEPTGRLGRMLQLSGIEVHEADEIGAARLIRRWRPDVISGHGAPSWVLSIAQQSGVPYVDNLHGMHMLFGADWRAETARGAKLAAIVAVSELVRRQYLAGNKEFPADRIVVIPNGVDDERRSGGARVDARRLFGLTDEYLFVSLARHCLQKNSYGLVAAFGELARRRPEAHLVIAGRPDDASYYRRVLRLRASMPCRDRIHLRDHVAAPSELLAAADGFVLDSFFEGWSLASMEALFAGLPVVLSDVGGAREQIGDDPARGYLVANPLGDPLSVDWESMGAARFRPQRNRDEFAAAMEHLVANREDYLCHRQRLAVESAGRFSADVCLSQHAAALRAVVADEDLRGCDEVQAQPPSWTGH
jgi:glycosyltransferase involved in cell wall biosynthesis